MVGLIMRILLYYPELDFSYGEGAYMHRTNVHSGTTAGATAYTPA